MRKHRGCRRIYGVCSNADNDGLLLALSFPIWALSTREFALDKAHAEVIFAEKAKPGHGYDHLYDTSEIDMVSKGPVRFLLLGAVLWLVLGSIFGVMASLKLHWPDWLVDLAPLSFGRVRRLHLNLVSYGWLSQVGGAAMFWILPRICHVSLQAPRLDVIGFVLWNLAVAAGVTAIALGWTDGEEWLEILGSLTPCWPLQGSSSWGRW